MELSVLSNWTERNSVPKMHHSSIWKGAEAWTPHLQVRGEENVAGEQERDLQDL